MSAENYNVAARLAHGLPAVDTVAQYVWACQRLGYQHQDLTLHPAQVRDWYGTEDGMDLGALQRGCVALDAAVRASQDALAVQDRQLAQLAAAWQGMGGDAGQEFLRRHGDASSAVAAATRTAAEALAALREDLWRAVSTKVDAAVAIEARAEGTREQWRAAAATVTSGVGDRSTASELIEGAVKPFVDTSVRVDWLAAMQAAGAAVTSAYERALAEIGSERAPAFGIPGALGPVWTPPATAAQGDAGCQDDARCAPATVPASWGGAASATPAAAAPAAVPPVAPVTPAAVPSAPVPPTSAPVTPPAGLGTMGAGMPDVGGGLSGLGQQFADTLGGLLGGGLSNGDAEEPPELPEPDIPEPEVDAELDEESDADLDEESDGEPGDESPADPDPVLADPVPVEEVAATGDAEPQAGTCDPVPAPTPAPPPAEPLPPAEVVAESTPCEIAADEVPQVGEPAE